MSDLEVWLIIILIIGVIASNLAVLKYSTKFKMTQFGKPKPMIKETSKDHQQDKDKNQNRSDKEPN